MATPAPLSSQPDPTPARDVPSGLSQVEDSLAQRILKTGPPWLRWTALVLAVLAPYAKYPFDYIQARMAQRRVQAVNQYSPLNAIADLSKTDPALREQLQKQDDDNKHIVWHHDVKNENPDLVTIYNNNDKGLLAYKVFDSDGCMLVERAQGALSSTTLVRRPAGAPPGHIAADLLLPTPASGWADSDAAEGPSPRLPHDPELIDAQLGCLNPHPGQFRFWYGQPSDQCWVPMFRQFVDGCIHYQMFNRCSGVFDSQIHWTQCVAKHFW